MRKALLDVKLKGYPLITDRRIPTGKDEFMNYVTRTICWWEGETTLRTVPLENVEYFDLKEVK